MGGRESGDEDKKAIKERKREKNFPVIFDG
jgi:hypothetical protein